MVLKYLQYLGYLMNIMERSSPQSADFYAHIMIMIHRSTNNLTPMKVLLFEVPTLNTKFNFDSSALCDTLSPLFNRCYR